MKKIKHLLLKLKAFSLAEVMISFIIVSAITAAFVPVMTKKCQAKQWILHQKLL